MSIKLQIIYRTILFNLWLIRQINQSSEFLLNKGRTFNSKLNDALTKQMEKEGFNI